MKGIIYIIVSLVLILFIFYYGLPKRSFITNEAGDKVVTVYFPSFFYFRNELFYIIPNKYERLLTPSSNYVLIRELPGALNYININWKPSYKYQLKIAFESGCIENKLDSSKYFFAENDCNDYLDRGESFYYPKYTGYLLDDILSKSLSRAK